MTGIIGGNFIGIFISDIHKNSLAFDSNLRCGDQILKVSGAIKSLLFSRMIKSNQRCSSAMVKSANISVLEVVSLILIGCPYRVALNKDVLGLT